MFNSKIYKVYYLSWNYCNYYYKLWWTAAAAACCCCYYYYYNHFMALWILSRIAWL